MRKLPVQTFYGTLLITSLLLGCTPQPVLRLSRETGPPSATETSQKRPTLPERVKFLEQYVTFRRNYEQLEYAVDYHNNGDGWVPGPSEWDIQIVAKVPADELEHWIPKGSLQTQAQPSPGIDPFQETIPTQGIHEWYQAGAVTVGLDRTGSIVAYRNQVN